jgi:hypothetical protein
MAFAMDRKRQALGLALLLGCAGSSPLALAAQSDNFKCDTKVEVAAVSLDHEAAPQLDPARLLSLYPDRARRMQLDGGATYVCGRETGRTSCVVAEVSPKDVGFEDLGSPLAALVTQADGQTLRLGLTFKVLEKGECRPQ